MTAKIKISLSENCPVCGRRLLDKTNSAFVKISLKCPHCHKIVSIDLGRKGTFTGTQAVQQ